MSSRNVPTPGHFGLANEPSPARSDASADAEALPAGTELGQYILDRPIGSGGFGIVYAAHHHALRQRVAIKVLRAELAMSPIPMTRFIREARAVNRIEHPNIVTIHEFADSDPSRPYYVMELLEGMDLRQFLDIHARFTAQETLELLGPVCEAIAAAHAAGVIHRDIKASNVMVAEANGQRVIKLLDFGIAKMLGPDSVGQGLTEPGAKLGTTGNMPPEQIRGEPIDERADIYALGVLMYQLLTGDTPFHGEDPRQIALLHLQAPAPRPSALAPVSKELDAVVLRCLEKKPERRFQSASALLEAFREAVEREPTLRTETSQAVAFYFEAQTTDDDLDDELLDDMLAVLELVQQTLHEHDYLFPLRTSNALLAVRRIAPDAVEQERARASELAGALQREVAARPLAHPALQPVLSMTLGQVESKQSEQGTEFCGGDLLDLESWTEQNRV